MKQFRMVPFIAEIRAGEGSDVVARQLADLINKYALDGWKYVRIEDVTTLVKTPGWPGKAGNPGCMGCFATAEVPAIPDSFHSEVHHIVVFEQEQ